MAFTADNRSDQFLMCRPQAERTALPVSQLEHFIAVQIPTAGRLPGFSGHQQGHQDFLGAMAVHFLAHNFFYTLLDAQTKIEICLLYTSPSPRDRTRSRMPSSA